jgi:hypothetical protein
MREMIWLAPDREVYSVSIIEEPWDEGRSTVTVVFRCDRTGWLGATELDTAAVVGPLGADDFPLLLKRARTSG